MNDRHTLLIAGPRMEDGMAILTNLWNAALEIPAEVVPLAALPQLLHHHRPTFLIIIGWQQEHLLPLWEIVHTTQGSSEALLPRVLLIQQAVPLDLPPGWHVVPPNQATAILSNWLS